MRKLNRLASVLLVLLLATSLLAACSGSKAPDTSTPGEPASQPAGPVKLVVGTTRDIAGWDTHNHNNTFTEAVHQHVFDYLVYYNLDSGEFEPGLATEWKLLEPTVWEFKLRQGVTFHNGEAFDAESVQWTLHRVSRDPELREHGSNRTIKEVQIIDPYTVKIVTHDPDPLLLNRLSRIGSGMLPSKYLTEKGWDEFSKNPAGTGAFQVKEWIKDDRLVLTGWADHWRGKPAVDELVFRVIPEEATRIAELQTGGIDVALTISADARPGLKSDSSVELKQAKGTRVVLMNARFKDDVKTSDPRVREAIERAIDKQGLVDAVDGGAGIPTRTRITPGLIGHPAKYYNTNELYDVAKAKQLLAEAGYPDGIEIGMVSPSTGNYPTLAQTIQGMLEKAGFTVNLEMLDPTTLSSRRASGNMPELELNAYGNSLKDADLAVTRLLPDRNETTQGYDSPRVTELIHQGAKEMDPAKRQKIYEDLSDLIAEERPQIFLYHTTGVHAVRKGVNWSPRPDEMFWFHDVTK